MDIQQVVASEIDRIRVETGYTYEMLSDEFNELLDAPIETTTIFRWKQGRIPRIDTLASLVRAYPAGDWRGDFARNILYAALGEDRRA